MPFREKLTNQSLHHLYPLFTTAPEVLNKKGYAWTIDWWSLGVCAFELVFGRRPFRGKTNSDLTHSITRESLRFPDSAEEKCSRDGIYAIASVREATYVIFTGLIGMSINLSVSGPRYQPSARV